MTRTSLALVALLAALLSSGCGTVCNLAGGIKNPDTEPTIYGGVRKDIDFFEGMMSEKVNPPTGSNPWFFVAILGIPAAEGVLTAIGDTLTLPITVYLQEKRAAALKSGEESAASPPSGPDAALGFPCPLTQTDKSP